MSEIVMMQAAVFQLRAAAASVEDAFTRSQMQLAVGVLANAVESAASGVTAAIVNEIEFALNDVGAAIADLPPSEAAPLETAVSMLRGDVESLKAQTALPADVVDSVRALQAKLKVRGNAIERQTYVESSEEPLPHPPSELQLDAIPLREKLAMAGFATPALDVLVVDPLLLRFHTIREIIDELDVIIGA